VSALLTAKVSEQMLFVFLFAVCFLALLLAMQRMFDACKNKGRPEKRKCDCNCKGDKGSHEHAQTLKDEQSKQGDEAKPTDATKSGDGDDLEDGAVSSDDDEHVADEKKKHPTSEGDQTSDSPFVIKPYIQLGTNHSNSNDALELVWHAKDEPGVNWSVKVKPLSAGGSVSSVQQMTVLDNEIPEMLPVAAHRQFRAIITDRSQGERFAYEVLRNDRVVFSAEASAPKQRGAKLRFIAVGDIGEATEGEAKVAYQMSKFNADFVVVPGDVAYKRGRLSENISRYFPYMNNDETSPEKGAPLMRSTLFVACPGNHDYGRPSLVDVPDLDKHADLFAYFYLWSQPLNGPAISGTRSAPVLHGKQDLKDAVLKAAGERYPRMANFSFDYGDIHWTFLDANQHMDWTTEDLRAWVKNDLSSSNARWKFVVFHQPSFSSHTRHRVEERMRLLCDIFQDYGVDIVFMGHAHWYERIRPLKFFVKPQLDGSLIGPDGSVHGDFQIDNAFDGVVKTRPDGIVYLVTGGGGAKLHESNIPAGLVEPYTQKIIADRHSFTVVDVDQNSVSIRQISEDGDVLDQLTVSK
jgi:hypothetical protein